jgi:protein TonB
MMLSDNTLGNRGSMGVPVASQEVAGSVMAQTSDALGLRSILASSLVDGQWSGKSGDLYRDFSGSVNESASAISLQQVTLAVLWVSALAIGVLGWGRSYPPLKAPVPEPLPIQAEHLDVRLAGTSIPQPKRSESAVATLNQPPPLLQPQKLPPSPQLALVASPTERLAFPVPVEGPVRVVPSPEVLTQIPLQTTQTSSDTKTISDTKPAGREPIGLSFGIGEGDQPAPEYPFAAKRARQTGVVVIRFSVGTDGRVLAAEVSEPSPWRLLNEEALRTIQRRWRFRPGAVRDYTVPIEFQLTK